MRDRLSTKQVLKIIDDRISACRRSTEFYESKQAYNLAATERCALREAEHIRDQVEALAKRDPQPNEGAEK